MTAELPVLRTAADRSSRLSPRPASALGAPPRAGRASAFARGSRRLGAAEGLWCTAQVLALAASVGTARASLVDHYLVPSGSMRPTLVAGDRIVVDKRAFGLRLPFTDVWVLTSAGPRRGDVVILRSPENGATLVKRVMGLPGERVAVRGGVVIVDGSAVEARPRDAGPDYGPVTLGPSEYLVLGDNRAQSRDGRAFGPVRREQILGRVEGVLFRGGGLTWLSL